MHSAGGVGAFGGGARVHLGNLEDIMDVNNNNSNASAGIFLVCAVDYVLGSGGVGDTNE